MSKKKHKKKVEKNVKYSVVIDEVTYHYSLIVIVGGMVFGTLLYIWTGN